jgi:hypothetical protein
MPATGCRSRWAQTSVANVVLTQADLRFSDNERVRVRHEAQGLCHARPSRFRNAEQMKRSIFGSSGFRVGGRPRSCRQEAGDRGSVDVGPGRAAVDGGGQAGGAPGRGELMRTEYQDRPRLDRPPRLLVVCMSALGVGSTFGGASLTHTGSGRTLFFRELQREPRITPSR